MQPACNPEQTVVERRPPPNIANLTRSSGNEEVQALSTSPVLCAAGLQPVAIVLGDSRPCKGHVGAMLGYKTAVVGR